MEGRVFFIGAQSISPGQQRLSDSAAQPPAETVSIERAPEHAAAAVRPDYYESELVMADYRFYSIPPDHVGRTRVLTSGSRHATSPAQSKAGALALTAARTLVTTGTEVDRTPLLLDHGGANGADTEVWQAAGDSAPSWETVCHPAQWNTHVFDMPALAPGAVEQTISLCPPRHRSTAVCAMAGHRRNSAMIALAPKLLLAMPTASKAQAKEQGRSRGTWGCVDAAVRAGIPTLIVWSPDGGENTPFRLFWSDEKTAQMITSHWYFRHIHARERAGAKAAIATNSIDLAQAAIEVPF